MKKFENPEMQIEKLAVEDVITTSTSTCNSDTPNCVGDLGMG